MRLNLRTSAGAWLVLAWIAGILVPAWRAAAIIQASGLASASLQPLQASCGIITQFISPQVIVDPGVEFVGGQFTPNAAGFPLSVQQVNSFGLDVDVQPGGLQVTIDQIAGSITGFFSNTGPVLRVNVGDLSFSGAYLSGITPTSTGGVSQAAVTSPSSVAIDFFSINPTSYDFQFQTTVPEPAGLGLAGLAILLPALGRRR